MESKFLYEVDELGQRAHLNRNLRFRNRFVDYNRKFLCTGVVAEKINVFSQANGEVIAPNITKGRAFVNRRVEIEFLGNVNQKYTPWCWAWPLK